MEFPIIETERLILREWESTDATDLFAFYSLEEVLRYTPVTPYISIEQAEAAAVRFRLRFREQKQGIVWAIELKESKKVIGECSLHSLSSENFRSQIGYSFSPEVWGKGIAYEALKDMIRYAFLEFYAFEINRLEATTDPRNIPSSKLLERLGFVKEGILRDYEFEKGRFVDSVMYSLLRIDRK